MLVSHFSLICFPPSLHLLPIELLFNNLTDVLAQTTGNQLTEKASKLYWHPFRLYLFLYVSED